MFMIMFMPSDFFLFLIVLLAGLITSQKFWQPNEPLQWKWKKKYNTFTEFCSKCENM